MSSSLFFQCWRSSGRTRPCMFPAKKARIGRCDTLIPPPTFLRGLLGVLIVVSGRETSLLASKIPSDASALHRAFMVFFVSSLCIVNAYGPCKKLKQHIGNSDEKRKELMLNFTPVLIVKVQFSPSLIFLYPNYPEFLFKFYFVQKSRNWTSFIFRLNQYIKKIDEVEFRYSYLNQITNNFSAKTCIEE